MNRVNKHIVYEIWKFRINKILNKKINAIYQNLKRQGLINYDKNGLKEHLDYWRQHTYFNKSRWYKVYSSISGKNDKHFIPESIYFTDIEPRLNDFMFVTPYADKNMYHKLYPSELIPRAIFRNIEGVFYGHNYENIRLAADAFSERVNPHSKLVVKKTIKSGGGQDVNVFEKRGGEFIDTHNNILSLEHLAQRYGRNYIVQEYVKQHDFFKKFNPSSVNTVRVFTYRSVLSEDIVPLQSVLRMGKKGAVVDNQASGGISRGIDNTGKLNAFAIDKYGSIYKDYNSVIFKETDRVPQFSEIIEWAVEVAKMNHYTRVLALDFCVDKNGAVKLLEINNSNNEINFHQMNNGPLFGEYTEEITAYCARNPKTLCSGFYLE